MPGTYQELLVWKKAIGLVMEVYRATQKFPKEERYGLTSQIRRSAVSIPSNIAEGQGRLSKGEFKQFLGNARGSLMELETQIVISESLGFLDDLGATPLLDRCSEVGKLLNGLLSSIRNPKS